MTTPFVDAMRQETMRLHSAAQKRGEFTTPNPSFAGYVRWIRHQREIHHTLRQFPVQPKIDLVEALDLELYYLELDATWNDALLPGHDPSPYAAYLDTLTEGTIHSPKLGCHIYNVVLAHLAGGNIHVAMSAASVLPKGWIETSDFFNVAKDRDAATDLKTAFDEYCQSQWTETQRQKCLLETPQAFRYGAELHRLLNDNDVNQ
jgi:hypothetical protein